MNTKFSELLYQYLKVERRLKVADLAKKIEITSGALYRWLNDDVAHPNCETVFKCAQALGLNAIQQAELLEAAGCKNYNHFVKPPEPIPVVGKAICHPCQFFGRGDALRRIYNAWHQDNNLQNIAIIGPRYGGKTSLLHYLKNITRVPLNQLRSGQPKAWNKWLPDHFQFALIDFKDKRLDTPQKAIQAILEQLGIECLAESCNLFTFSDLLKEQNRPTVILMDEIEAGLETCQLDTAFWQQLRCLAGTDGQIGIVVTAHDMQKIAQYEGKSSPFFGIFSTIYIEPFTQEEAKEMLASSPIPFEDQDRDWIIKESGCWPALLQILCYERLLALEEKQIDEHWKKEGLKRLKPYHYLFQIEGN
ncbi:MAG: ATP-binding protein [Candidatus Parabeggiatoa sp. nov. 3]|nr:MAG: ATP-binding protein [Gammaproteobacteria bacterium]RKZ69506.1 MAG: ATP-binding protein [Gammaproteobacteria bacterium]RKZ90120.1 MAG: ATP-binding protein [Gammaproteobacteria bacterium]